MQNYIQNLVQQVLGFLSSDFLTWPSWAQWVLVGLLVWLNGLGLARLPASAAFAVTSVLRVTGISLGARKLWAWLRSPSKQSVLINQLAQNQIDINHRLSSLMEAQNKLHKELNIG